MSSPSLARYNSQGFEHLVEEVRGLTSSEYSSYLEAARTLFGWHTSQERYKAVRIAFTRYSEAMANAATTLRHEPWYMDRSAISYELNNCLSDYLRAVRSFLDRSVKDLSDKYGKTSAQIRAFEKATNDVYDANFSYRLMDQVRNYTQHVGDAIERVSYGERPSNKNPKLTERYLSVGFDRDSLLAWKKLKALVRRELQHQPRTLPVAHHLLAHVNCIDYLNIVFVMQQVDDIKGAAHKIANLTAPLQGRPGVPIIAHFESLPTEAKEKAPMEIKIQWMPLDLVQQALALPLSVSFKLPVLAAQPEGPSSE